LYFYGGGGFQNYDAAADKEKSMIGKMIRLERILNRETGRTVIVPWITELP